MAPRFDPYERWLGIPATEHPPSHYRLLGLDQFEFDPDMIRSAADRVMDRLHELSDGEHADEKQRLLTEVTVARRCLLHADKKKAYDVVLCEKTTRGLCAGKPKPADGPANQPRPFMKGLPVPLPKSRKSQAEPAAPRVDDEADSSTVPSTTLPSLSVDKAPVRARGRRKACPKNNFAAIAAWTVGGCFLLVIVVGVLLGTASLDDGSTQTRPPTGASYGTDMSPPRSQPRNPDPRGPYGGRSLGDLLKGNPDSTFSTIGDADSTLPGDGDTGGFSKPGSGTSTSGDDDARSLIDAVPGGG